VEREEIEAILPHRAPFLMLDRIVELEPGQRGVGVKNVREDEFWVPGHFPGNPILPGVLVAEALAQMAAVIWLSANRERVGQPVYLVGMDKMRFRRIVKPGDELLLEVSLREERRKMLFFDAVATVGGQKVADGQFLATMPGV
jgi:3-hydroxyacyl-[acyl-carrier-protein] dehydratase